MIFREDTMLQFFIFLIVMIALYSFIGVCFAFYNKTQTDAEKMDWKTVLTWFPELLKK